jgi:nucleotide-binding universal stress UspA family protein
MTQSGTTVVGIDGSTESLDALRWAVRDAEIHHSDLVLINAMNVAAMSDGVRLFPPSYVDQLVDDSSRLLTEAAAMARLRLTVPHEISVTTEFVDSSPVQALLDRSKGARLLVVGTRGSHITSRGLLGSTSDAVASHSHCPVAVVKSWVKGGDQNAPRPVVVGTDLSATSAGALTIAFDEANRRRTKLTVVHAWSDLDVTEGVRTPPPVWSRYRQHIERLLAEELAPLADRYPEVVVRRVVVRDRPAQAILDHGQGAQMVVVGSHGRGGFGGMLLGSVSRAVLHRAQVPVIVVRDGA